MGPITFSFRGKYKLQHKSTAIMRTLPIRLHPNQDLRAALEATLAEHSVSAAFVLQGIGSLSTARIRYAGMSQATELRGDLEILTLSGSLSTDGAHLHIAVADAQGRVVGGHVADGCIVRTTAEILLALLPAYHFSREPDAASGWKELAVRSIPGHDNS
jgi:predicted DNA-binding protein with PD1-like motif